MTDDRVMLSARVPKWIKRMVDADPRNNQEVLQVALEKELGGERKAVFESRIENKRQELEAARKTLETERENVDELRREIEALEEQVENATSLREQQLAEANEVLEEWQLDPANPAVKNWADKLDMTPAELIEEVRNS